MRFSNRQKKLEESFNRLTIRNESGCWDWSGSIPKKPGYGRVRDGMKQIYSHRASWIIHYGEIPKGLHVLHKCDNKKCTRPDHLFLGTNLENIADMLEKKRHPTMAKSGEQNHMAKLNVEQIKEIRSLKRSGHRTEELSIKYGVCRANINDICAKRLWGSV